MAGRRLKNLSIFVIALACALGIYYGLQNGAINRDDEINILIMGIDSRQGLNTRSDSLNVFHIDFSRNRIGVLAIPRDTLVDIPGHGEDKINHAHVFGGPELSCLTASNFLKIPIHYYIEVNMPMFVDIVDSIGGITLNVEKSLYYQDYAGDLHINLSPGRQHLSGYEAMGYVRFRHDATSDWGRIDRQHKFFEALAAELSRPTNIWKLPSVLYGVSANIRTNLGPMQALKIGMKVKNIYRSGNVVTGVIPGGDARLSRGYYMLSDPTGKQEAIDKVIYGR